MTSIVVVLFLLVAILGAAALVQHYYGLPALGDVPRELRARLTSIGMSREARYRARYNRAVTNAKLVMPDGRTHGARHLLVVLSSHDLDRLAPHGDFRAVAVATATLYNRHARRYGWVCEAPVRVYLDSDETRLPGWTPLVRMLAGPPPSSWVADSGPSPLATTAEIVAAELSASTRPEPEQTTAYWHRALLCGVEDGHPAFDVNGSPAVVGRGTSADVVIDLSGVSARHAELRVVGGQWHILDLGSTNGTWLDGRRIEPHTAFELVPSTIIQFRPGGEQLCLVER